MRSALPFAAGMLCLAACLGAAQAAALSPPDEASAERTESICRITAQEQGLAGAALDRSVASCVTEENPNLAYWENCRQQAQHQHLSGAALKDSVNYCMSRRQ